MLPLKQLCDTKLILCVKVKSLSVKVKSLSRAQLFATPWIACTKLLRP